MNEVAKFLHENPIQYLATIGSDGKAKMSSVYVLF